MSLYRLETACSTNVADAGPQIQTAQRGAIFARILGGPLDDRAGAQELAAVEAQDIGGPPRGGGRVEHRQALHGLRGVGGLGGAPQVARWSCEVLGWERLGLRVARTSGAPERRGTAARTRAATLWARAPAPVTARAAATPRAMAEPWAAAAPWTAVTPWAAATSRAMATPWAAPPVPLRLRPYELFLGLMGCGGGDTLSRPVGERGPRGPSRSHGLQQAAATPWAAANHVGCSAPVAIDCGHSEV